MSERYQGNAYLYLDGSDVPIMVTIDIDDLTSGYWRGTIDIGSCDEVVGGDIAHVTLLDPPHSGTAAPATIGEPTAAKYVLTGHRAFVLAASHPIS